MKRLPRPLLLLLLALPALLAGCGHDAPPTPPMPPTPAGIIDPSDAQLRASLTQHLQEIQAPAASTYDIKRFDLNNDRRRDALILMKTPYGFWCGKHGCTLLVMQAHNDHFTSAGIIRPLRAPVHILSSTSHGWKDLSVRLSGHETTNTQNVRLKFDGKSYAGNPYSAPTLGEELFTGASVMLFQ